MPHFARLYGTFSSSVLLCAIVIHTEWGGIAIILIIIDRACILKAMCIIPCGFDDDDCYHL